MYTRILIFLASFSWLHANDAQTPPQSPTQSQETIILWHALDGELGNAFQQLLNDFSKQEPSIKVEAVFKGNYDQTLAAYLESPDKTDVVQIFEMGTVVMQNSKQFTPIKNVFSWNKQPIPAFIPAMTSFYKAHSTELQCVPFSASTVVLFYNKTLLDRANIAPPKTFEDFHQLAYTLKGKGVMAPLASGWLSGHHMDQIGAIHNIPIATHGNGIDKTDAKLVTNPFFETHWTILNQWHRDGLFSLKTGPEAEAAFANEEIVFLSQGANRLPLLKKAVNERFEIGVVHFPYWKSVGKPQKTIAGGSAFWVSKNKFSPQKKRALSKLMTFLADSKTQYKWQAQTGYIPTVAVPANPDLPEASRLAQEAFSRSCPSTYNRGILLPNFPAIRTLIVDEMTKVIKGDKTSRDALQTIEREGNILLRKSS